jgi:hypothetical protein
MYLGATVYRIHDTNQPQTIGKAVSSGCFRLINADVIDLYDRVPVGTKVIIKQAVASRRPRGWPISKTAIPAALALGAADGTGASLDAQDCAAG